jgi:hypothetical protein
MNAEIWTEAALFPEKEYINGIFIAVHCVFDQIPNVQNKHLPSNPFIGFVCHLFGAYLNIFNG